MLSCNWAANFSGTKAGRYERVCFEKKSVLAIVLVEGENVDGPHYICKPFTQKPDRAVTRVNLDLNERLKKATSHADT